MDEELRATIDGCTAAHRRLEVIVAAVDDEVARRASRLPGWTVGHVLTHLARNAESHVRMLGGALAGQPSEQYPGGREQRDGDIERGAGRPAAELRVDVVEANAALEAAWARMTAEAWAGHGLAQRGRWPCARLPFHRWREVEVHCVDLGLDYSPRDWPEGYVARELPEALDGLPDRLSAAGRTELLAWLFDRSAQPPLELRPWE
jgi:maleylpyruvate isomerase